MFALQLKLISELTSLLKTNKIDLVVMNEALVSLNYEIIKAISKFLRREKIHHTITLHREKKSIIYKIRIRGWENVEKTIEKIKPKHPKIVVKFLNLLKFKP